MCSQQVYHLPMEHVVQLYYHITRAKSIHILAASDNRKPTIWKNSVAVKMFICQVYPISYSTYSQPFLLDIYDRYKMCVSKLPVVD